MTTNQAARYKSYVLSLAFLKENQDITKEADAFASVFDAAWLLVNEISNIDTRKTVRLKGVAETKEQLQDELVEQAVAIASVISGYAAQKSDPGLKEAMNFTRSELFYGSDQQLGTKCRIILEKARELTAQILRFGITPEKIETFAGYIDNYTASINEPRSATAYRKQAGMQMRQLFDQLRRLFTEQLDPMMMLFKATQREFYDQYLIRRMIVNPAQRKTKVQGKVRDKATLQELADVAVSVKGLETMPATTDAEGRYSLQTPLLKRLPLLYYKEGYKPGRADTTVSRGKTTTLDVELERE